MASHPPHYEHHPGRRDMRGKHDEPCTVALKPAFYEYLLQHVEETPVQKELREKGEQMERPFMMASADEYAFLGWLCETIGAKRVVEVGVFRGVTTLAIALHLPDDGLIRALDVSREFADVGLEAWKAAGVDKKIDFIEGPAAASMQRLLDQGEAGTYDFVFIDANKDQYPEYYELALQLLRKGGVIAVDNTLLHGRVIEAPEGDAHVTPLRQLNATIKADKRVAAVMSTIADGVYFVRKL